MKNGAIFTIFKKELSRFFKDKRTLVALLMPGLLIYLIYSLMGSFMSDTFIPDEEYKPSITAVNIPDSLSAVFTEDFCILTDTEADDCDPVKELIKNGECDLLIVFPEGFDESLLSGNETPNVELYFNSASTNSAMAYQTVATILDAFESSLADVFTVNAGSGIYDLASEEDMTGMLFSMLMPMLLVMLLFSGCMAVAPESIAGEKERGTIATMLITPTKRSHIAIGKILALSLMALLSGASSTLGVVLSLPKLMGDTVSIDGNAYTVTDYAMLAVVILSTVMLFITLISVISAYAKTVKEATTYVTPLMIISMLIGVSGMMGSAVENPALYLIPIFNSVHSMIGIFSFEPNIINMLITIGANIAFTAAGVFILTKMFNSEKIMFNK